MASVEILKVGAHDATKERAPRSVGDALINFARSLTRNIQENREHLERQPHIPRLFNKNNLLRNPPNQEDAYALVNDRNVFGKFRRSLPTNENEQNQIGRDTWFKRIPVSEETKAAIKTKFEQNEPTYDRARAVIENPDNSPQDERVAKAVEQLFDKPEDGDTVEMQAKKVAEDLTAIAIATGNTPQVAREVQHYLNRIQRVYKLDRDELNELIQIAKPQSIIDGIEIPEQVKVNGNDVLLRDRVNKRIERLENTQYSTTQSTVEQLQDAAIELRNITDNNPDAITMDLDDQAAINRLQRRIQDRLNTFQQDREEEQRRPGQLPRDRSEGYPYMSKFQLNEAELRGFYENPKKQIRKVLYEIREQFEKADQGSARTLDERLGMYAEYLTLVDDYELMQGVEHYFKSTQRGQEMTEVQRAKHTQFVLESRDEVRDLLNIRRNTMYASYTIQKLGDTAEAKKVLTNVGRVGFQKLLQQEGGLVGNFYQKYTEILREMRRDSNGNLVAYTDKEFREAKKRLRAEIRQELPLYKDRYELEYGTVSEGDDLEAHIDDIILLAEDAASISLRDMVPVLSGKTPYADFENYKAMYNVLDQWNVDLHLERFARLGEGQIAMYRMQALAAAHAFRVPEDVDAWFKNEHIAPGSVRAVEILNGYFPSEERMSSYLKINRNGSKRDPNTIPEHFKDVSEEDLKFIITAKTGEMLYAKWIGGGAEDFYSSGWKMKPYHAILNDMYGADAKGLALGIKFHTAWSDYLGIEMHDIKDIPKRHRGDPHQDHKKHAKEHLIESIENIAEYRPFAIFDMVLDTEKSVAVNQFNIWREQGLLNGIHSLEGNPVQKPHDLVSEMGRRFRIINQHLAESGNPPVINYGHLHLSETQRKIVDDVCTALGDESGDAYLNLMHHMAEWGSQSTICERLTLLPAAKLGLLTPWIDDIPKEIELPGDVQPNTGDTLVRTWGDLDVGKVLPQIAYELLDPDKKRHLEAISKALPLIPQLGGGKVLVRGAAIASSGYMKLASTYPIYDWLFMGDQAGASPTKEWFGQHGESMGLGERHEMLSDLVIQLRGVDMASGTVEWLEDYLGLKKGSFIDGTPSFSSLPLNIYKSRLFMIIILGIVLAGATTSAMSGFGGGMEGGSGGGGGHGGGGHH